MASFYIQPENRPAILYELHATTSINVSFQSTVTEYKVEKGKDVSDNVVVGAATVSFSGILTDVKQSAFTVSNFIQEELLQKIPDYQIPIDEYIEDLRARQANRERFYVYFSGDNTKEGLEGIDYAILTSLDLSKTTELGNSWSIDISMKEVRLASRAQLEAQPSVDYSELLASNSAGAGNSANGDISEEEAWRKGYHTWYKKNFLKAAEVPTVI